MIKACNGFLVLKKVKEEKQFSKGGLTLPSTHVGFVLMEVISSSNETFKVGTHVVVEDQRRYFTDNNEDLYFVKTEDVLGIRGE